jgi:hypothetical protein
MNLRQLARAKARKYGLDPDVFERQIQQESGFNPRARSPAGAQGVAQIMPATARGWKVDPMDPKAALDAAARNMAGYVKRYGGYENALRAYNAGPGAIQKSRGYSETNNYVKTILGGLTPRNGKPSGEGSSGSTRGGGSVVTTEQTLDREALAAAQGRQVLAQMFQRQGRGGNLLKLGVLSTAPVNPSDFLKTSTVASATTAAAAAPRTNGGKAKGTLNTADLVQAVKGIERLASGVPITAKQEPGHASGGDHDPAVQGATARDFGGSEAQRAAAFRRIARELGVPNAQYKGADLNITKNGVRYQVISRDHGSGPHLHVGLRKVRRR